MFDHVKISFLSIYCRSNLTVFALNNNNNINKYSFRRKLVVGKPIHDSRVSEVLRMQNRLECTLAHFASETIRSSGNFFLSNVQLVNILFDTW